MRGDSVEIVIDVGDATRTYVVQATRAGRRVEVSQGRGTIEVVEVNRSGTPIRTARFMAARVVAVVEHPAGEAAPIDVQSAASIGGRAVTPSVRP